MSRTRDGTAVLKDGLLSLKVDTGSSILVQLDDHIWCVQGASGRDAHECRSALLIISNVAQLFDRFDELLKGLLLQARTGDSASCIIMLKEISFPPLDRISEGTTRLVLQIPFRISHEHFIVELIFRLCYLNSPRASEVGV